MICPGGRLVGASDVVGIRRVFHVLPAQESTCVCATLPVRQGGDGTGARRGTPLASAAGAQSSTS